MEAAQSGNSRGWRAGASLGPSVRTAGGGRMGRSTCTFFMRTPLLADPNLKTPFPSLCLSPSMYNSVWPAQVCARPLQHPLYSPALGRILSLPQIAPMDVAQEPKLESWKKTSLGTCVIRSYIWVCTLNAAGESPA